MKHSLELADYIEYRLGNPEQQYLSWCHDLAGRDSLLVVDFELDAYWLDGCPKLPLTAIYFVSAGLCRMSVTDQSLVGRATDAAKLYRRWCVEHQMVSFASGEPIELDPLIIPKPWGREIWYTGVEARGVCCLVQGASKTPIPWLQAVVPGEDLGIAGQALVLLKVLDPSPEPVLGDLYFELHEQKQEVYVVTHIDEACWPDGVGYIRMGFDAAKLESYDGDAAAFRRAFLRAVQDYEAVRRKIDSAPRDEQVCAQLEKEESTLREYMDSFSQLLPLGVGDVVKVPLLSPHSLQHGVRTVEFQTPVYERKILSFAQRVLTQDHWDTEEAVDLMRLETPPTDDFTCLESGSGLLVERIVDFSDFEVSRVRLSDGASTSVSEQNRYTLIMVIEGSITIEDIEFGCERALVLPRSFRGEIRLANPAMPAVFLLATPRH